MNEQENFKNEEVSSKDSSNVMGLLKRMQCQMDSIEKKIDSLSQQSKLRIFKDNRSSAPRKEYAQSKRSYGRKHEGKKEEVNSEGRFYHGRPFGKKKDGGKSNFKGSKRSSNKPSRKIRSAS